MTAALFKDEKNKWDYVEVIYASDSDYQKGCQALYFEDADKLIGMHIDEIKELEWCQVLRSKWHTAKINSDGRITSLIC